MKKNWLIVGIMFISSAFSLAAHAGNDSGFLKKFAKYRAKYNISTYRAAVAFANSMKVSPEKILKRYITASFEAGGRVQEIAVVQGVDAFKESGMSHEMALEKVSDTVGQMTETLNAIYQRASRSPSSSMIVGNPATRQIASRGSYGRGPASVRDK